MIMLPSNLREIVANLDAKIEDSGYSGHAHDVFKAIRDCIVSQKPIESDLQEQYVRIIANDHAQDRYGK